jgi:MoxR-like ATPase
MSDHFRRVTPLSPAHDTARAKADLRNRALPGSIHSLREGAEHYQLERSLELSVNIAIGVGAPLLVTGEPGTGKTQLAWYLRRFFDLNLYEFVVRSNSTAESLKYTFDAVRYLHWAQSRDPKPQTQWDFVTPGPLWLAYADPEPSILLIDEIDKAPRDFPNDLLHELDQHRFEPPFEPRRPPITPNAGPPIVVITSNVERRLPDAFLRRCIYHHIELNAALVNAAVEARRGDFPALDAATRDLAIRRFFDLRERELSKKPSVGELLVWLTVLSATHTPAERLRGALADLPALQALVKEEKDRKRL